MLSRNQSTSSRVGPTEKRGWRWPVGGSIIAHTHWHAAQPLANLRFLSRFFASLFINEKRKCLPGMRAYSEHV